MRALACMVLLSSEFCAFTLQRPFLRTFEIRELIAFGATDYLAERVTEAERIKHGHVALLHQACSQLEFFDCPLTSGRIPQWSNFYQAWF